MKNSYNSTPNSPPPNDPIKNWAQILNRYFSKEEYRWSVDIWKDAQRHKSSERCTLKPQWHNTSHLSEWLSSKKSQVLASMWSKGSPCALSVGMQIGAIIMGNSIECPQKVKSGTAFWPSDSSFGCVSKGTQKTNSKKKIYTPLCSV